MATPHTHGGTDAPECTTCSTVKARDAMCKVGALYDVLPDPDRLLLATWSEAGTDLTGAPVPAETMARALTAEGHQVGATTVKAHRRGVCACT